jgi:hypothetical protein
MNPARLFISYRSSDGVDKATALARDLNAVFGDAQVFLDKEDLPAGQPWREAIGATLDDKPVLLLLVTPHTFGQRIAEPDDPVRRELTTSCPSRRTCPRRCARWASAPGAACVPTTGATTSSAWSKTCSSSAWRGSHASRAGAALTGAACSKSAWPFAAARWPERARPRGGGRPRRTRTA